MFIFVFGKPGLLKMPEQFEDDLHMHPENYILCPKAPVKYIYDASSSCCCYKPAFW